MTKKRRKHFKDGHPVAEIIFEEDFDKSMGPKNSLLDFFRESPFPKTDLDIEREDIPQRYILILTNSPYSPSPKGIR